MAEFNAQNNPRNNKICGKKNRKRKLKAKTHRMRKRDEKKKNESKSECIETDLLDFSIVFMCIDVDFTCLYLKEFHFVNGYIYYVLYMDVCVREPFNIYFGFCLSKVALTDFSIETFQISTTTISKNVVATNFCIARAKIKVLRKYNCGRKNFKPENNEQFPLNV